MKLFERIKGTLVWSQTLFYTYFGRRYHCKCGHTCKRKTLITVYGYGGVYVIDSKNPEYCPECFANAAIQCAWCGEPILPGDPITLYAQKKELEVPEYAVVYKREPRLQLVGCLGWNCAGSGIDRAGFWILPGKVRRVATPLEMLIANGGDEPMIFHDLSDQSQATPISEEETS